MGGLTLGRSSAWTTTYRFCLSAKPCLPPCCAASPRTLKSLPSPLLFHFLFIRITQSTLVYTARGTSIILSISAVFLQYYEPPSLLSNILPYINYPLIHHTTVCGCCNLPWNCRCFGYHLQPSQSRRRSTQKDYRSRNHARYRLEWFFYRDRKR